MAAVFEHINGDRTLKLGDEQYIRRMSFGANWNRLRIICRCAHYATAGFTLTTFIGVTAGGRGVYANDSDSVGLLLSGSVTFNAGPPQTLTWIWGGGSNLPYIYVSRNNTFTFLGSGNTGARDAQVWPVLQCWGVDLVRNASSFTAYTLHATGSGTGGDFSRSIPLTGLYNDMEFETNAAGNTFLAYSAEQSNNLAYAGSGNLDSVVVFNRSAANPLYISDIIVHRQS
jgi:hypothetical protein